MSEFKPGDKAEFRNDGGIWMPVSIKSQALRWEAVANSYDSVYLVQHDNPTNSYQRFLVYSGRLRPVERWKKCAGTHRTAGPNACMYDNMERRVE